MQGTNHAVDLHNRLAQVRGLEAGGGQGTEEGVEVEAVVEVVAGDGFAVVVGQLRGAENGVGNLGGHLGGLLRHRHQGLGF